MEFQVLIIEDDDEWQEIFRKLLSEMNLIVDISGNSQEAKQLLAVNEYHLILLDLCLDGDEYSQESKDFCDWLIDKIPHIPKLITSGQEISKDSMFDLGKRSKEGYLDFISKNSLVPNEFRSKVNQLLKKHQIIRILHLSDIHLTTMNDAQKYGMQLETDLDKFLKVEYLDYLVISGDIAQTSNKNEYLAASAMVKKIITKYKLDNSRLIVVPGNHDVNWDLSEKSYHVVSDRKKTANLDKDSYYPGVDQEILLVKDSLYKKRFDNYSKFFYLEFFNHPYPIDYADQGEVHFFPNNNLLFITLNSSWQIDHHYRTRSRINMQALAKCIDKISDKQYDKWLKIAVWHHPVTGLEMMNDEFMQLLSRQNVQICLHGHNHEAAKNIDSFDPTHKITIIGAGSFGAPSQALKPGIPLQYNLLILDKSECTLTVETRKKEKPEGAWLPDARWGSGKNPKPRFTKNIKWGNNISNTQ